MRSWRIDDRESAYLHELLESGFPNGSADADFIGRFERAFAAKFGTAYAISCANGTATLHAALAAAGVQEGDEVIVPPLTMASTSLAVLHQRAVPVFADIDPETFTIDPASIAERITDRTRAIIPVALYGLAADMDPIMQVAREHDLVVIEDAAQCILGQYKGRIVGTIGDFGSFSFQSTKHMSCGEGGMVITSNPKFATRVAHFVSLGYTAVTAEPGKSKVDRLKIVHPSYKRHESLGFNYRMSELCAAFALAQLEKLDQLVAARQRVANAYAEVVNGYDWLRPQAVPPCCIHSAWAYVVRLVPEHGVTWQQFFDKFVEHGGEWFYGAWRLTYLEPYFQNAFPGRYPPGLCPVAERTQPFLIQLKTNFHDPEAIARQVEALARTLHELN